ncbi:MAG: class I SAM-dependent methyltransferase [Thermonemataceae bacterium]|nr:class I SAM-dependent methyltransferase [Thermonemataceae bacterium]
MFLTKSEEHAFIEQYKEQNPQQVSLKLQNLPAEQRFFILQQIEGYQKAKEKLPSFAKNSAILYPPKLNLEQASSERTALFKAQIIKGKSLCDITGGFGVDSWAFSHFFEQVCYIEQNPSLATIAKHNFATLNSHHIKVINENALTYLEKNLLKTDWIFIDPARRNGQGKGIAQLQDTQPNILEILGLLFSKSENILLKASPMLDISEALKNLVFVRKIWVISLANECKEVLYELHPKEYGSTPDIYCIDIQKDITHQFVSNKIEEENATCSFSPPKKYLYEPNSSLLKAGFFQVIAEKYKVSKLHTHGHLYTSDELITDFQGKIFEIEKTITKNIWKTLKEEEIRKAHISVRNFPMSVAEIRKKTGITEGNDAWVFATTLAKQEKALLLVRRVLES